MTNWWMGGDSEAEDRGDCVPCRVDRRYLVGIGWVDLIDEVIVDCDVDRVVGCDPDEAVWLVSR